MKNKRLLAIILLSLIFCFVISGVGYGEVQEWMDKEAASAMDISLLEVRIDYIMQMPNDFLDVSLYYDSIGIFGENLFSGNIDSKGKIIVRIEDTRDFFAAEPEVLILGFAL